MGRYSWCCTGIGEANLRKQNKRDSKQKVDARIILNEEYLHISGGLKDNHLSDKI